jgi:hypothetical protein
MNRKIVGKKPAAHTGPQKTAKTRTYPRPSWVPQAVANEEELCPDCFKVVGERSRYKLVCIQLASSRHASSSSNPPLLTTSKYFGQ